MRNRSNTFLEANGYFLSKRARAQLACSANLETSGSTNRSNRSSLNRSRRFFFATIQFPGRIVASFLSSCNLLRLLRFVTSFLCKRVHAPFLLATIPLRFIGGSQW